jgi:hypothetical protein
MLANKTAWKLETDFVGRITSATADAVTTFNANSNPETKNHKTAAAKIAAFRVLRACISEADNVLRGNLLVSDAELTGMGFRSRVNHAREPLPVPDDAPELTVIAGQHHEVTIFASMPLHGRPVGSMRKKSYYGLVVRFRVEGREEWREELGTRLKITLEFATEDVGKHVTVLAAWMNPRLQRGPWSDETVVLVN